MASTDAPVYQPLVIEVGADFEFTVPFTDAVTGNPIPVGSPKMQIRDGNYTAAALILAPTISAAGNTVTVTISAAASLALTATSGAYDLFATRTDTNAEVKLLYGPVTFVRNITTLP